MVNTSDQSTSQPQYDWQNPNLKKFDFGRMMGRAFNGALQGGKRFWLPILLIFGVPTFLMNLWPMLLPDGAYGGLVVGEGFEGFENFFTPMNVSLGVLLYFAYIFVYAILYIGMCHNMFGIYIEEIPSFQESFQRGTSRVWAAIGATILFSLGVALGMLLLIIPGVLLMLGWYLIGPIIALEDKGVTASLSRSWEMSKGSKRWILLYFIVMIIISLVTTTLFSLISLPFGTQAIAILEGGSATFWILNSFATTLSQLIVFLLTAAGLSSIYYEILDIKEGVSQNKLSAIFD